MARSFNQVILVGNLTRDPELRATSTGQELCRFGLAVNYSYNSPDGTPVERVDFIDIVAWGNLAKIIEQYCRKGKQILVRGALRSSSWEQDGQTRTKLEVSAQDILLLGGSGAPRQGDTGGTQSPASPTNDTTEEFEDADYDRENLDTSDIPF